MRRLFVISLAISFVLSALSSFAQTFLSTPTLPDYSQWQTHGSIDLDVTINGKDAVLELEIYDPYIDWDNLKRYRLNVVYNEKHQSWLALLVEEVGQKNPDGTITTKESHTYLFENNEGKWSLAKDFSQSQDFPKDMDNFVKTQYGLEPK